MKIDPLALTGIMCKAASAIAQQQQNYGVDVSFPMHYSRITADPHNGQLDATLGNRQEFYDRYLEGCRDFYGSDGDECFKTEEDRIAMNFWQPQSMQNYTELGFTKTRAPENVFKLLKQFWDDNNGQEDPEEWFIGNTFTNHWEAPTMMLAIDDETLKGGGRNLKYLTWDSARKPLQEWMSQELTPISFYGVRKYTTGAVLAPHVDKLPLVASAIINVAQDVDEAWPLEMIGHDGKAHSLIMEPGDMVLYESHSVIHGRPFPLKGRFYANVFVHFEPVGHSLKHGHDPDLETIHTFTGGHENSPNHGLPPYILEGSPEAALYRQKHPELWEPGYYEVDPEDATGSNGAHYAAAIGDHVTLWHIVENHRAEMLHEYDNNGWLPLHEAARRGHLEALKVLVDQGADVNDRTSFGEGFSALHLAYHTLEEDHPVIAYLLSLGAEDIAPEQEL